MSDDDKYEKVAKRWKDAREYSINSILQDHISDARISLHQLEDIVERSIDLINESDKKEHIYSEAGDMIYNVTGLIEDLKDSILSLAYMAGRRDYRDLKNRIPVEERNEIDETIRHSHIAEKIAEKYVDSDSNIPEADPPDWFHKDDPALKTDQRTDEHDYDQKDQDENEDLGDMVDDKEFENVFKNQGENDRRVQDWSDSDTSLNRPEVPDDVRFH